MSDELNKVVSDKACCDCTCQSEICDSGHGWNDGEDDDYCDEGCDCNDDPYYLSREQSVEGLRKVIDLYWSKYYATHHEAYLVEIANCETTILANLP